MLNKIFMDYNTQNELLLHKLMLYYDNNNNNNNNLALAS